ncbi:CRISPR-associated endonuclease Cas2 [Kinneretia asaccharophila]|uniref:CRISPR-associated endoribonuclease Cas2 n=1 Tax=Roseateles asaccharophilus TaxID=582607 RepID=A0A4R6NC27_9BURK|nr:CRISPR-associated endonuclease Cas2 [Roseateles asaccharophilus]MDN3542931.1 CRISPR-associated endonuclease Cas2 [Roseateles asaccharophilus]TDP13369.1 CRISPR-associated Cas2 family protein [Roseateles asaccharophilus]
MLVIVCYDVNTETKEGRRRLRRVAKVCEGTGQRVQKSVFECQVTLAELETLERRLLAEINEQQDCLRLYRVPDTRGAEVREYGHFKAVDFEGPLVL